MREPWSCLGSLHGAPSQNSFGIWEYVVPEFGDQEEVLALYEAVFDGAGDAFTCFLLVAVICEDIS